MPALDSIIKLNKVQKYLINEFKDDMDDEQFIELKEIIANFFSAKNRNQTNNTEAKINWTKDIVYYEVINHAVRELTRAYFKLAYNYSSHSDVKYWNQKEREWREYGSEIKNMFIESKEKVQEEIDRILNEYKEVLEIEKKIAQ